MSSLFCFLAIYARATHIAGVSATFSGNDALALLQMPAAQEEAMTRSDTDAATMVDWKTVAGCFRTGAASPMELLQLGTDSAHAREGLKKPSAHEVCPNEVVVTIRLDSLGTATTPDLTGEYMLGQSPINQHPYFGNWEKEVFMAFDGEDWHIAPLDELQAAIQNGGFFGSYAHSSNGNVPPTESTWAGFKVAQVLKMSLENYRAYRLRMEQVGRRQLDEDWQRVQEDVRTYRGQREQRRSGLTAAISAEVARHQLEVELERLDARSKELDRQDDFEQAQAVRRQLGQLQSELDGFGAKGLASEDHSQDDAVFAANAPRDTATRAVSRLARILAEAAALEGEERGFVPSA